MNLFSLFTNKEINLGDSSSPATYAVAGIVILLLCSFSAGYFIGKKQALQEMSATLHQELFADQLHAAVAMLHAPTDEQEIVIYDEQAAGGNS